MGNIKEKVVIGIKRGQKNDRGKIPVNIYYKESFDPDFDQNSDGFKVGELYTTLDCSHLKVGDHFRALYDVREFWNSESRKFEKGYILADLEVIPFDKK